MIVPYTKVALKVSSQGQVSDNYLQQFSVLSSHGMDFVETLRSKVLATA